MEREEAERRELRKMMMEGALGGKKKDKDSADSPALPPGVTNFLFSGFRSRYCSLHGVVYLLTFVLLSYVVIFPFRQEN